MAEMDLNIDNYSITDLENFFKVRPKKYSFNDIEKREYEIREQLLSSGHMNKRFKQSLIVFLKQAKDRLAERLPQEPPPTSIPKNAILDTDQIPRSAELATSRAPLIIERPPTNYMNVQTSEFYQGVINPLNKRSVTKYITVDTRFRDTKSSNNNSSSDFMINLPIRINKVVSMQLTGLELPKNFYSISQNYGNNYFTMQIFQIVDGIGYETDRTVIIPDGNYTAQGLINEINNILCPTYPDGLLKEVTDIFSYIKFSLSTSEDGSGSNKVVIALNPEYPKITSQIQEIIVNFGTDGKRDAKHMTAQLGWNLGFTESLYEGSIEYTSEKPIEANAIKYIYIAVDDYNKSVNNTFITAFEKNGLNPHILARISMNGNAYDNVIINKEYEIISEPRIYFGPVDIQRLHITLFDDLGRILHMKNTDYSFCLKFIVLYDL